MKKNNNKKIIIIISVMIILIIILLILNKMIKKYNDKQEIINNVKTYTSVSELKTIEEVAIYLDCKLIKTNKSKDKNFDTDIYMQIKYELYSKDESYEEFYKRLILYCAEVLKYKSFKIIDDSKNIHIEVKCNENEQKITLIIINGDENYFQRKNSELELKKINEYQELDFNIQSKLLQEIVVKKWSKDIVFGSKDSEYEKYDIYFDEGVEVRIIDGKIYNIIFTSKYKDNILNDINSKTSKEDIIKKLGEPTFENEQYGIIGYKSKDFYMFCNSTNEISIYRIDKEYDYSMLAKLIDEYLEDKDFAKLIKEVKTNYKDFDQYSNNEDKVSLKYTLKGIEIILYRNKSNQIIFYNNYNGKIYKDLYIKDIEGNIPDNILIKNINSVFNSEVERLTNIHAEQYNASMESLENKNNNYSNKFLTIKEKLNTNTYSIKFRSINEENANSELRENVNYFIWIDDYNFIYSITGKGMYIYNAATKKYGTLAVGQEKYEIKEYSHNVLKYDDKSIEFKK